MQQQATGSRRESRGKSHQNPPSSSHRGGAANGGHFSPMAGAKDAADPDEVAIDQVQRRSRRKVSHHNQLMKQNESSDLEQTEQ